MKTVITGILCFTCGAIFAFACFFYLLMPSEFDAPEYIRTESRVVYTPNGGIKEAYFYYPTFEAYYDAIARESGFTILTEDLPKISNSHSMKDTTWESVMRVSAPVGYESVLVGPRIYKIQKQPNQSTTDNAGAAPRRV